MGDEKKLGKTEGMGRSGLEQGERKVLAFDTHRNNLTRLDELLSTM